MGLQIESGSGNGKQVAVSNDNRFDVNAKANGRASYVSKDDGQCYFWTHSFINTGNGDTILWLANTSTTKDLYIEKIHITGDVTTQFTVHSPAYAAPAGSVVTGTNANRTSGNVADASCYGDETNNTQGNVLFQGHALAFTEIIFPVDGKIVLGYHDCIAVDFVTLGTLAAVSFVGYYEDKE